MSIGQRIAERLEELGKSQRWLAEQVGIKQPTINALIKDGGSSKHVVAIADALGLEPAYLDKGVGPKLKGGVRSFLAPVTQKDVDIYSMPRDLPVRGAGAAGDDGLFDFNGQTIDNIRRPPRLAGVKDAYALYVTGESMIHWRENGQIVYVHPHLPPVPMDYVVVQLTPQVEGEPFPAYIKRLVRRTANEIKLRQYNPPKDLSIPAKKIHSIHKIVDWDELLGI